MSTIIESLKNKNGEVISPITSSASVFLSDNTELSRNIFPVTRIIKSLQLTTDWQDTGIVSENIGDKAYNNQSTIDDGWRCGAYIIFFKVYAPDEGWWNEYATGIIPVYTDGTNSTVTSEIPLSWCGHATNGHTISIRWARVAGGGYPKLQIKASSAWNKSYDIYFYFRKII